MVLSAIILKYATGKVPVALKPKRKTMNRKTINALVFEDEAKDATRIQGILNSLGCTCTVAGTVAEGLKALESERFEIAIVDMSLPDGSGFDVVRMVQAKSPDTKIMVLTSAVCTSFLAAQGLRDGADDYVLKSITDVELAARIGAMLRSIGKWIESMHLRWHNIALDVATMTVTIETDAGVKPVELPHNKVRVLMYLMMEPGKPVSHEFLATYAFFMEELYDGYKNFLSQRISEIREVLGLKEGAPGIVPVRGVGYALVD